ncbi:MAG: hypothetical protein NTW28_29460 [Candidatus Solibacter sp.]|nr:hypothetical protein [Candidatus Solibacter sp.]
MQNGGGVLMDFGCYLVNWSLWLKGRPEMRLRDGESPETADVPNGGGPRNDDPEL